MNPEPALPSIPTLRPVRARRVALLAGLLVGTCALGAPKTYFDAYPATGTPPPDPRGAVVAGVKPDGPGDRAGVQAGDIILALRGKRIRSLLEVRAALQGCGGKADAVLLREGRTLRVELTGMVSNRMQCVLGGAGKTFVDLLRDAYQLPPARYLGTVVGARSDRGLLDRLAAGYDPRRPPRHPLFVRLTQFPPRGLEALDELAPRAAKDRPLADWVEGFAQTHAALLESRFEDAKRIIRDRRLHARKVHPFLDDLLAFYVALLRSPPDALRGPPADGYGVDATFALLCYPFPVVEETRHDWAGAHATFAQAVDPSFSWFARDDPDRAGRANELLRTLRRDGNGPVWDYLAVVATSLVDHAHHGGWATRFQDLESGETRRQMVSSYRDMIVKGHPLRMMAALALLVPSLLADDAESFGTSYALLAASGTVEHAFGNTIVQSALKSRELASPACRAKWSEIEGKRPAPPLYRWWASRAPGLASWLKYGYFQPAREFPTDLGVDVLPGLGEEFLVIWPVRAR